MLIMNKFGEEFRKIVYQLHEKTLIFNNEIRINFIKNDKTHSLPVIKFEYKNFSKELIKNCYDISVAKAEKTMNQDQAGQKRSQKIKIINQFRGILAESIVHLYLHFGIGIPFDKIKRYDLERKTFDYNPEEYDIKIVSTDSQKTKEIEVRSSNNPYKTISRYLANRGIICTYTNKLKKHENAKDISFAVIYSNYKHTGHLDEKIRSKFFQDFKNENYQIYLITHCATKQAFSEHGETVNLGQGNTEYIQVPFYSISDEKFHVKNLVKY